MAGQTRQAVAMESRRLDLMTRLCALDAALASQHERAITVEELSRVWDLHHDQFAAMVEGDLEWVDPLLQTIARRHGILGLVRPRDPEGTPSEPEAGSRKYSLDKEGDILAAT